MSRSPSQFNKPVQQDAAFGIVPIFIPEAATIEDIDYFEYLVVQHHAGHWGFPKGHAEADEAPQAAACREFCEETGIDSADFLLLPGPCLQERYRIEKRKRIIDKTVTYFPARVWTKTVAVQPEEICAYAWGNYHETFDRLTYEPIKCVLREVRATAIERFSDF
ncbi:MAG: NUDIX domain-containing protein [Coleofasciculaceae cyanobacterium RL_1_1]|nr:NUDIX domain-containing protein [Coleofasciculaceae cyanobacterium RL_1_1]